MRNSLSRLAAAALMAAASTAFAFNCPNDLRAIDAKLASNPPISKETADKVAKLRAQAEAAHASDKHSDAMRAIGEAKKLLGM